LYHIDLLLLLKDFIVTMTIWTPILDTNQPKYLALAQAIEDAIHNGELLCDEKLPPQRRLADVLHVTIGTITRAYSEAERRGLVVALVGSGTYVRGRDNVNALAHDMNQDLPGKIDMRAAFAPEGPQTRMVGDAMVSMAANPSLLSHLLPYAPELGHPNHRSSFQRWLSAEPVTQDNCNFLITHGGQHAISVSINALCREGDSILTENLVFPGILAAAQDKGVKVISIAMDDEGIIPEKMLQACQRHKPRMIYLTPNSQNPCGTQLSIERRQMLVDICREYNVLILEDDVQYIARSDKPISMQQLAPEQCIYLSSFSKRFGGAMRIGFLVAPVNLFNKIRLSLRASSWTNSPILIHWLCEWMDNGELEKLEGWLETEMNSRQALAKKFLSLWAPHSQKSSFNLWLVLPHGWLSHEFVEQAQNKGVLVRSADDYRAGQQIPLPAVRLCLSRPNTHKELTEALNILKSILEQGPLLKEAVM
jgi:DNA-binding transcriptional MocR family regulator